MLMRDFLGKHVARSGYDSNRSSAYGESNLKCHDSIAS